MASTYEPIATTTLTGTASSITLSSIPSTYTDLIVSTTFLAASGTTGMELRLNGDTGANYSQTWIYGDGTSVTSSKTTASTRLLTNIGAATTTIPITTRMHIMSYAGSTYKTILFDGAADMNGSGYAWRNVGLWRSTSAVNSITLGIGENYAAGTIVTIYGIKSA